jgi:hypothetical protein
MNKDVLNIYLLSSEWDYSHRKSFVKALNKKIGNTIVIQYPISLIINLFFKFKNKILGYLSGKYKPMLSEFNIEIITPIMLFHKKFWHKFKYIAYIDSILIAYQVNKYISKKYPGFIINLWVYIPADYYLAKYINYNNLIYDYYDDSEFDYFGNEIKENIKLNSKLVPKCDLIICISEFTTKRMLKLNQRAIQTVSGFDSEIFKPNSAKKTTEIDNLDSPIIGYNGALRNWIDFEVLKYILEKTDYYLVSIGYVARNYTNEFKKLKSYRKFIHIEYKNILEIPAYIKKFSVGILPYVNNNFTKSVFPYKFFEYMAMGIPIVSSPLPELQKYDGIIGYSTSKEEFVDNCVKAVNGFYDDELIKYDKILIENSWERVFEIIKYNILEIYKEKNI